jgi:multiple sugar transport system substrate-binding protein
MPRQLSETDRAVVAALCREYTEGRRVPAPATPDEILDELRGKGIDLDVDELRARLRRLCAEYGVEEDRPDVMRAELVKRLGEDGWIERWSRSADEVDRSLFQRLQASAHGLLGRLPDRRMVAGLGAIAAAVVVAVVLVWPNEDLNVIDPDEMTGARGVVRYCVGDDVAGQHQADRDAFNRRFAGDGLTMQLVPLGPDANQQFERFSGYQNEGVDRCDVLYADVIWIADLVAHGWLVDLSRYREVRKEEFVRPILEAATLRGKKTWGIPKQAEAGLIFYRTGRGLQPPSTWGALYEQAYKPRLRPKQRLRYQALAYEGLTVNFLEIAFAAGAKDIITPEGRANIDQGPTRDALRFMVDGIGRAAPQAVVDQIEPRNNAAFEGGRADFMRNWPSYKKELRDHNPDLVRNVATAPLPRWRNGGRGSVLGGHILVIPRLSKNRGAALKAIDFLSSKKIARRDATMLAVAPALSGLWDDPDVRREMPEYLKKEVFDAKLRPLVRNYQAVSRAIYTNVNRALRDPQLTPAAALALANSGMNEALRAPPEP